MVSINLIIVRMIETYQIVRVKPAVVHWVYQYVTVSTTTEPGALCRQHIKDRQENFAASELQFFISRALKPCARISKRNGACARAKNKIPNGLSRIPHEVLTVGIATR